MKEIEKMVKTLVDGLKSLSKGIDAAAKRVDAAVKGNKAAASKAKPVRRGKAKKVAAPKAAAQKAAGPKAAGRKATAKKAAAAGKGDTAINAVYDIISRAKNGADTVAIKQKTGFNDKKVQNIIYKLKKQGRIQSPKKGIYAKA